MFMADTIINLMTPAAYELLTSQIADGPASILIQRNCFDSSVSTQLWMCLFVCWFSNQQEKNVP